MKSGNHFSNKSTVMTHGVLCWFSERTKYSIPTNSTHETNGIKIHNSWLAAPKNWQTSPLLSESVSRPGTKYSGGMEAKERTQGRREGGRDTRTDVEESAIGQNQFPIPEGRSGGPPTKTESSISAWGLDKAATDRAAVSSAAPWPILVLSIDIVDFQL